MRGARGHPWLDLRDGVTALVVEALHDPHAARALAALAARLGPGDAPFALPPEAARPLREAGVLDAQGRLVPEAARRAAYLRERCRRAEDARRAVESRRAALPETPLEVVETLALLDAGLYFEAHDRLEPDWRRAPPGRRELYQALIQTAVALQHLADGNAAGAASLLDGALERLERAGAHGAGLALGPLRDGLRRASRAVRSGANDPAALLPPFLAAAAAPAP